MQRTRSRFANRSILACLLLAMAGMAVFVPGCSDPLTLYHVPGSEAYLARGGKILVLPFMDTRAHVSNADKNLGDMGEHTRNLFVEALHEFNVQRYVEVLTPKMPRRTRSLTNAQVAELGRRYGADVVIAGQVFSFDATRAASIPPRAGMFVRVINAHDGSLLFVGDHYRSAPVPGASGGRDLQALYVSARLIEGFISKVQPSLMASGGASGGVTSTNALAMLSSQPAKKGLLARMFRSTDKPASAMSRRKLFAWGRPSSASLSLGSLLSSEANGGVVNRNHRDGVDPDGRKKKVKEPGNVPETERLLGMTASFLFSPDDWDEQFVPEVPPLIDFGDNFYQLPAPPSDDEGLPGPLPAPPSFSDGEEGDSAQSVAGPENSEAAGAVHAAAAKNAATSEGKRDANQKADLKASEASQTSEANAEHETNKTAKRLVQEETKAVDAASGEERVDASTSWVVDELPEIDMSRVYPNSIPVDAPYPAPAPSAGLSGDELASDLFADSGETWFPAPEDQGWWFGGAVPEGPVYSEPINMWNIAEVGLVASAPYQQPGQSGNQSAGNQYDGNHYTTPHGNGYVGHSVNQYGFGGMSGDVHPGFSSGQSVSDAVVVPYTMTGEEAARSGYGASGQVSFQLDPDTLEIMSVILPAGHLPPVPASPAPAPNQNPQPGAYAPVETVSPMISAPSIMMPAPAPMMSAPVMDSVMNDPFAQSPGVASPEVRSVPDSVPDGIMAMAPPAVVEGEKSPSATVGVTAGVASSMDTSAMAPPRMGMAPRTAVHNIPMSTPYPFGSPGASKAWPPASKSRIEVEAPRSSGYVPDELEFSSSARSKPLAKRPPDRRRSRSQSVKGTMVQSRARVLAKEAENRVLDGPLLDGRLASAQPRLLKSVENELPEDPYLAMQDPMALVAMPRFSMGGVKVLLLPYHERSNSNNLIYNTGGGEVVTTLFGVQLASDLGLSILWDATGKATHNRLVSAEDAIEMGRMAGADYVIRGDVLEFRRSSSVSGLFSDSSGVDVATEMYRTSDGLRVMSRRDRSQQRSVIQAEKTVRRLAEDVVGNVGFILHQPLVVPMASVIDVADPASVMGHSVRRRKVR